MTDLRNDCEGTSGSTIVTGGGSPDSWDLAGVSGAGAAFTYSNTHAHTGTTSAKLHYPASVATAIHADWKASIGTAVANPYGSVYVYLTASPTVNLRVGYFMKASVGSATFAIAASTRTLKTFNSSNTNLATTTAVVPLNQWARIDFEITGISGSTGTVAARLYSGANLETLTADTGGTLSTAGAAVVGTIDEMRIGNAANTTHTSAFDAWFDDPRWSSTASPGPYNPVTGFIGWGIPL